MPGCAVRWYGYLSPTYLGESRYNSTHFCCCQKSYNGLEYYQVSGIYNARPRTLNLTPSVTSPVALCSLWHAQMLLLSRCLRHTGLYSNIRPPILNLKPLSSLALPESLSDARMPLSRCSFSGGCILKCCANGWNCYRCRFVILLLLLPSQVLCCKMVYMMLKRSLSRITFMTRNNGYIATVGLDIIWVGISTCILPMNWLWLMFQVLWVLHVLCSKLRCHLDPYLLLFIPCHYLNQNTKSWDPTTSQLYFQRTWVQVMNLVRNWMGDIALWAVRESSGLLGENILFASSEPM